jgi:hypothetical protein
MPWEELNGLLERSPLAATVGVRPVRHPRRRRQAKNCLHSLRMRARGEIGDRDGRCGGAGVAAFGSRGFVPPQNR